MTTVPPLKFWEHATTGVTPPPGVTRTEWLEEWGTYAGYAGVIAAALQHARVAELPPPVDVPQADRFDTRTHSCGCVTYFDLGGWRSRFAEVCAEHDPRPRGATP